MSIIVKGKSVQNATILLNDHVVMGQSNCHFDNLQCSKVVLMQTLVINWYYLGIQLTG